MALNRVKLVHAVTFMNYLASVFSLMFLPKSLIWNKITFRLSSSLNLAVPVANELTKSISKKLFLFAAFCVCLKSITLRNYLTSPFFLFHFSRITGTSEQKKHFTDLHTANTIQLFVAIK